MDASIAGGVVVESGAEVDDGAGADCCAGGVDGDDGVDDGAGADCCAGGVDGDDGVDDGVDGDDGAGADCCAGVDVSWSPAGLGSTSSLSSGVAAAPGSVTSSS